MTVPAIAEDRQPTRVEAQRTRLDAFMGALEKRNETLATLLTDSGVDPAFFLAVARRALTKSPDLLGCTSESLMQAFINAATDGLPPDGRKGAITYFKMKDGTKTAQWNPMVQGLLDIAYRSRLFLSIDAQVVYEGEAFEYELGDNPFIRHKRNAASVAARKIVNAYAIAKTTNGGIFREVMEKPDLDKVRAVSRAQNGPNKDWPEEMARKAPLRRLWKYLPKTPAMERVIDHDDHTYDLTAVAIPKEAPKSLKPGFQPQLVHDQTPTMTPHMGDADLELSPAETITDDGEIIDLAADAPADDGLPVRVDDADEFPADRAAARAEAEPNKPASEGSPLSIDQRIEQFKKRVDAAPGVAKLKSLWVASAAFRSDVEAHDPAEAERIEQYWNAAHAVAEDKERAGQ